MRRYGRVFQAGTQQRSEYGGKFYRACELVRNGRIGELERVYAYRPGGYFQPEAGMGRPVGVPEDELAVCFPEMREVTGGCRYWGCSHSHEPACAVKDAVGETIDEVIERGHRGGQDAETDG